jgi:4-amino-4-deoxy-L-arabinose transferase-like glycosyltransferase
MQAERPDCVAQEDTDKSTPLALAGVLVVTLLLRLIAANQPIVENYVGRQVPTAMVARNLQRGSGLLWPQIDTAPFPNYFMVEPPVYQLGVVSLQWLSSWRFECCGRIVSAMATVLAAWALFGLVRRRGGSRTALASVIAFSLLPVTLRYGRAFQPDALMLGGALAGLECWDRSEQGGGRLWLLPAWLLLAIGFAAKITSAFVLAPLVFMILHRPRAGKALLAASAVIPVLLWYVWMSHVLESGGGSRASAENRAIWLAVQGLGALGRTETLWNLWRFLLVRAFTPLGLLLASWGLCLKQKQSAPPDIWRAWAAAALLTMALLAEKLHHEYYWLCLAPAVAAGIGRAWDRVASRHRALSWALAIVLAGSSCLLVRSTWQVPREWRDLETAAAKIQAIVSQGDWLVAPEALLFQADRRGCRLEYTPASAVRAAGEWPGQPGLTVSDPADLIDFYRSHGARFVADVAPALGDQRRIALHELIRQRYKVLLDDSTVILAELNPL